MKNEIYALSPVNRILPPEAEPFIKQLREELEGKIISQEQYDKLLVNYQTLKVQSRIEWMVAEIRNNLDVIAALKAEKEHIQGRIDLHTGAVEHIKNTIKYFLLKTGITNIKTPLETIYTKAAGKQKVILPLEYEKRNLSGFFLDDDPIIESMRQNKQIKELISSGALMPIAAWTVDKNKIKEYLQTHKIEGIALVDSEDELIIKGLNPKKEITNGDEGVD